jgi:hypothetical protein
MGTDQVPGNHSLASFGLPSAALEKAIARCTIPSNARCWPPRCSLIRCVDLRPRDSAESATSLTDLSRPSGSEECSQR